MRVSPDKGVVVELTPRQVEVIELYADGLATKTIAHCLRISPKTVEYHRTQIYAKTKVNNLIRLTKWAIRAGLTGLACVAFTSAAAQSLVVPVTNATVTLAWSWPTNYFTYENSLIGTAVTNPVAFPAMTNLTYRVYSTTTLSGTNTPWVLAQTLTNPPTITNSSGIWVTATVPVAPWQATFYAVTVANFSGTSFFSGLAASPAAPPSQGSLLIQSAQ